MAQGAEAMTRDVMALADEYANACFEQALNQRSEDPEPEAKRELLVAAVSRIRHNCEVLTNALWKACGDDEQVVTDTIESQGTLR